jgi:hypothetical protein
VETEGPEDHGSAFLIGRISDVVRSPFADDQEERWLVRLDQFARVSIPNVWDGSRNPVRYTTLEELGIDPGTLRFEPAPAPVDLLAAEAAVGDGAPAAASVRPLTMAEAKRGLAAKFGVRPEDIEIVIRG